MEHVARDINQPRIHGKVGPLMIAKIDHAIDWDPLLIRSLATLFVARLYGSPYQVRGAFLYQSGCLKAIHIYLVISHIYVIIYLKGT